METGLKKYEIAYVARTPAAEDGVSDTTQKIHTAIEAQKGIIAHSEMPRKHRLSYPIEKMTQGVFGWVKFSAPPSAISAIEKGIKTTSSVLRFILVEDTIPAPQMPRMPRYAPTIPAPAASPKREEEAPERLDLEELDKKLEEILGK